MAIITEASLRALHRKGALTKVVLQQGEQLTPAAADFLKEKKIPLASGPVQIPVGVSNRHVHLSPEHVEILFGRDYALTPLRELSQPGQFAAREQVTLTGPKGSLAGVRVLGPSRGETQVEISKADGYVLGVHPPVRLSGHIEGTPGITVHGPRGSVTIERGLIVAQNHVHLSPDEAAMLHVKDGDTILLRATGERKLIFADVAVRVSPRFRMDFHIDLDEANAAGLSTGDTVEFAGINGELFPVPKRR